MRFTAGSIVNSSPTSTFREFDLQVHGEAPGARILEIEVLGSPLG